MKNMKKRGIWSLEFTGKLILALVFVALGTLMIREIAKGADIGYNKQLCKMSVIANTKARLAGKEFYNINCPTRYVTIEQKKYIIESKDAKDEFKIECGKLDNDESKKCFFNRVNRLIANLIFDCWDQFAAGQLPVFSQYYEDRQCLICARIEFNNMPHNLDGFYSGDSEEYSLEEFMRKHNPIGHEITYYEFSLDETDAFLHTSMIYEYDLVNPMTVVFSAMNEDYFKSKISAAWDKVKKVVFKDKTSDIEYEFVNALDFVKYDEVREHCDTLR